MKILFALDQHTNAGSIQAVANYVRTGDELGHEIAVYGQPDTHFPHLRFSSDVSRFDYVVFIIESRLGWISGLRLTKILNAIPRKRRAILDADGMYNRSVSVNGYDRNHPSDNDAVYWRAFYGELADKILQPSFQPRERGVVPLLFYGYDSNAVRNGNGGAGKCFDIVHIGHNWWRWHQVSAHLLPAIERIRSRVGKICFLGLWWDGTPSWASAIGLKDAFQVDPERFRLLNIDVRPPIPYTDVISTMSTARVNIMTQRPLFRELKIVTSKYFEILSAETIPLVMLDPHQAELVYGAAGRELALDGNLEYKLLDALHEPAKYKAVVAEVRRHLAEHHSYRKRVQEIVAALADA